MWVECCTTGEDHRVPGVTECWITEAGSWTPWAGAQLALRIPEGYRVQAHLDVLAGAAENIPSPVEVLRDIANTVLTPLGESLPDVTIKPQLNVTLPESFGLVALIPAALFGLVVGGGIAWVLKK
jgi:hypothetical protein